MIIHSRNIDKKLERITKVTSEVVLITKSYLKCDIISWVDHYLNWCGFDHVKIVDNDTTCCNIAELFKNNEKVEVIFLADKDKYDFLQTRLYKEFVEKNEIYTYQFFCDDDEYLWFNKNKYSTINDYLTKLNKRLVYAFAIPMVNISYKSTEVPDKRKRPMKEECFYVNDLYYTDNNCLMYKSFIHRYLKGFGPIVFNTPHFVSTFKTTLPDNRRVSPAIFQDYFIQTNPSTMDIKLFHYFHRSLSEWEEKLKRNRIDVEQNKTYKTAPTDGQIKYPDSGYTQYLNPFN